MFIGPEVHVNNVNITDPHFNMFGQCRSEHHKIVNFVCLGRSKRYFPSIPMEMKGFRNDPGQIVCTIDVPAEFEPGCKMQENRKKFRILGIPFLITALFRASDRGNIRFFPLPVCQYTCNQSSYNQLNGKKPDALEITVIFSFKAYCYKYHTIFRNVVRWTVLTLSAANPLS